MTLLILSACGTRIGQYYQGNIGKGSMSINLSSLSDLECILTFCDNATEEPNSNGANYNFTWNGWRIPIDTFITYPCQNNMAVENTTKWKNMSSTESQVYCDPSDGMLKVSFSKKGY